MVVSACPRAAAFLLPESARKEMAVREHVDNNVSMSDSTLIEYTPKFEGAALLEEKVHTL